MTARTALFPTLLWLLLVSSALAADVAGGKDSPLLKRYEGSTLFKYSASEFDAYTLPLGAASGLPNNATLTKFVKVEGKVTRLTYVIPPGRSALEVIRNYEAELKAAGYTILFKGAGTELGNKPSKGTFAKAAGYDRIELKSFNTLYHVAGLADKDEGFLAARLDRPEGPVHVAVYALPVSRMAQGGFGLKGIAEPDQVFAQVDIIEAKTMETRMVTVSAGEMGKAIAERGSIALYGIHFDTNSAEVKPESTPALVEIAKLVKEQPGLKLLVVGHTDSVGTLESNMDLSSRRAKSVVQALTAKHGAEARRLVPVGVAFASPIASNKTEDGKAKNRRVQLVEF